MKNLMKISCGLLVVLLTTGCPRESDRHSGGPTTTTTTNTPPNNPTQNPGEPDLTKENTIQIKAIAVPNSTLVSLGLALIGAKNLATDPKKFGTLPPTGYRLRGTFSFDTPSGRKVVIMEVDTTVNPKLTAGPVNYVMAGVPNLTFKLEVVEGIPNTGQAFQVVETPIPTMAVSVLTEDKGISKGFGLTSNPL
jgi:hypothetical protein